MWMQWSQQAAEIQLLWTNAEIQKKADYNFYKMDEESIVTIREDLSDDFFSLAESISKPSGGWMMISLGHNFSSNDTNGNADDRK